MAAGPVSLDALVVAVIAKVRIAPFERWCEWAKSCEKNIPAMKRAAGLEIRIIAESCQQSPCANCGGKIWQHEDSSVNELRKSTGLDERDHWIFETFVACEHMLEMD